MEDRLIGAVVRSPLFGHLIRPLRRGLGQRDGSTDSRDRPRQIGIGQCPFQQPARFHLIEHQLWLAAQLAQERQRQAVEGPHLHRAQPGLTAQQCAQPLPHLSSRSPSKGNGHDLPRVHAACDQPRNAPRQHPGLARPWASHDH